MKLSLLKFSVLVISLMATVSTYANEESNKDYEIVSDIKEYQKRIYPEVYNLADNSWYMLNSLNEYEKYGVVVSVPNKHKWHALTSTYYGNTKQENDISHYLGFTALRIAPSSASSGKIYFNNFTDTATIKETDEHYYINTGTANNLTLTRVFPGKDYYSRSTTYNTSNGLTQNNDGKYYYMFDQTMYLKGVTSASTKASCVEVFLPDLSEIPTYQGKIAVMNDSLYIYDEGYWRSKGKNQTGWIELRNDLDHHTLASALRFDLSENIGYGCCWASFCNGDENVLQFSPWDKVYVKSWDILQNRQYMKNLPLVSGTSATYELNFAKINLSPSYFNGGDFNYAFFTTQVYLDELPARYADKDVPQEVTENSYNANLESGTTSCSMTQMGGNVTKCIGYYIKNNGTESITLNKVIMRDASLLNEVSSSTDANLLGTLAGGETKSLSVTIHQDIDLVYEWQYTYKGMNYTFKSWNYDVVKASSIELNQTSLTIKKGETATLTATVKPDDAKQKDVSWSSSDQNVVSIDSNGNLIGIGVGTAIITATATDGSGVKATCTVTVEESETPSTGDYNSYLQSGSDGSSLVQIGSYVTKSVGFHITNNGTESIYITKLTCKKASDKSSVVSTSTDTSLLGTLEAGATKSLSVTIHQNIDLVYEWEYTYKGNSYIFQSWENYPSAIGTVTSKTNNDVEAIYDTSGHVIPQMQKGINIVKMCDGSIKKVIKK